jgi:hypothetical protein
MKTKPCFYSKQGTLLTIKTKFHGYTYLVDTYCTPILLQVFLKNIMVYPYLCVSKALLTV